MLIMSVKKIIGFGILTALFLLIVFFIGDLIAKNSSFTISWYSFHLESTGLAAIFSCYILLNITVKRIFSFLCNFDSEHLIALFLRMFS